MRDGSQTEIPGLTRDDLSAAKTDLLASLKQSIAIDHLIERLHHAAYVTACSFFPSHDIAENMAQEAALRFVGKLISDEKIESPNALLKTITVNLSLSERKKANYLAHIKGRSIINIDEQEYDESGSHDIPDAATKSPLEIIGNKDDAGLWLRRIQTFGTNKIGAEAWLATEIEGLTFAELAEITGNNENRLSTSKSRFWKAFSERYNLNTPKNSIGHP